MDQCVRLFFLWENISCVSQALTLDRKSHLEIHSLLDERGFKSLSFGGYEEKLFFFFSCTAVRSIEMLAVLIQGF